MRYWLLIFVLFCLSVDARENPFAPALDFTSEPLTKPIPAPDFNQVPVPVIKAAVCETAPKPIPNPPAKSVWKQKTIPQKIQTFKKQKQIKKRVGTLKRKKHPTPHYQRIYRNENLTIYTKANQIKIVTGDSVQKHFKLSHPLRIVLDFGDSFVIYPSVDKPLHSPYLKRVKIGTHDCFYRITFITKRTRHYRIQKRSYGYLITLF